MQQENPNVSFRIAALILKKLRAQLTEAEARELDEWLNDSEANQRLLSELSQEEALNKELDNFGKGNAGQGWQRLQDKIATQGQIAKSRRYSWKVWLTAAAAMGAIVLAMGLLYEAGKPKQPIKTGVSKYGEDVLPGTQKAELILGNGTRVALGGAGDSSFTEAGNTLKRTANGLLRYKKEDIHPTEPVYNTVRTPNGGEFAVLLDDGTKVWLNAASSLRYPVPFIGGKRQVELTGEAYFDIAKDKEKPFIVATSRMQVQVLGTEFNINSYVDTDSLTTTTLVEGSVKVKALNKAILLQPGEQIKAGQGIGRITRADVEAVTAWKNGLFIFNNTPLKQVMEQLTRWYDIKVIYTPRSNASQCFTGEIKRDVPISKLLTMMEMTGIARFNINERTVTIWPYNN